jgi:hypothetical protein
VGTPGLEQGPALRTGRTAAGRSAGAPIAADRPVTLGRQAAASLPGAATRHARSGRLPSRSGRPPPDAGCATFAIACSPSIRLPLALRSGREAGVIANGAKQQRVVARAGSRSPRRPVLLLFRRQYRERTQRSLPVRTSCRRSGSTTARIAHTPENDGLRGVAAPRSSHLTRPHSFRTIPGYSYAGAGGLGARPRGRRSHQVTDPESSYPPFAPPSRWSPMSAWPRSPADVRFSTTPQPADERSERRLRPSISQPPRAARTASVAAARLVGSAASEGRISPANA